MCQKSSKPIQLTREECTMTHSRTVVTGTIKKRHRLPAWTTSFAVIAGEMFEAGKLQEILERFQVKRKGGYAGLDGFLFLLLYFTAKLDGGFKGLSIAAKECSQKIGALAGQRRLITQQSLSRLMSRITAEHVNASFMEWLLVEAAGIVDLLRSATTWTLDCTGGRWRFFDFDGTLLVLRKRGLPKHVDLPAPDRRVDESFAAPGYPGRKRGEIQMCRETLQDAGSGAWLGVWCAPGNGHAEGTIPEAAAIVASVMRRLDADSQRGVIRFDGAYGSWSVIAECIDAGSGYLVRWGHYEILSSRSVVSQIEHGQWERVRDSCSGPVRFALDIGYRDIPGTDHRARMVISRYRDETGAGVGISIDGWRYELFMTSLPADCWPATEVVTHYYGRIGQENRFGQEDKELRLDRIFSEDLPAQAFATLVGLFVWNIMSAAGLRLSEHELPELPAQMPRIVEQQPEALPYEVNNPLVELLDTGVDWSTVLNMPPQWQWTPGYGLECAAGYQMHLKQIRKGRLVFRAPAGACLNCPIRKLCTNSTQPRYRRELRVRVDPAIATEAKALKQQRFKASTPRQAENRQATVTDDRSDWKPALAVEPGTFESAGPFLVPSELRHDFRRMSTFVEVFVDVACPSRLPAPRLVAPTPARRQRRRLTWMERDAWNALPPSARVRIKFDGRHPSDADRLRGAVLQKPLRTQELTA